MIFNVFVYSYISYKDFLDFKINFYFKIITVLNINYFWMPRIYPKKIEMDKTINLNVRKVMILPLLIIQCCKLLLKEFKYNYIQINI